MTYSFKQLDNITLLIDYHIRVSKKDQIIKAIEELASLNKMLCKLLLGEIEYPNLELLDELFDADVMIMSMKRLIVDEVSQVRFDKIVNDKLERELKRWGIS